MSKRNLVLATAIMMLSACKPGEEAIVPVPEVADSGSLISYANQGDTESQFVLGTMYFYGIGVEKNIFEAKEWFAKAAHLGDTNAQITLGSMFFAGEGVPENRIQAYAWFNLAKAFGNSNAASMLRNLEKKMTEQEVIEGQKLSKEKYDEIQNNIEYAMKHQNEREKIQIDIVPTPVIRTPQLPPAHSSSISSPSTSSSSSTMPSCIEGDWDCTSWGECNEKGKQYRDCVLVNHQCLNALSVKPATTRTSSTCEKQILSEPEILKQEQPVSQPSKLDEWNAIHQEMIKLARDYVNQGAPHYVYNQLDMIEDEFILRFNEYVNAYNDVYMAGRNDVMKIIEKSMEEIVGEFHALPAVVY